MKNLTDSFLSKVNQLSSHVAIINAVVTKVATKLLPNTVANAACSCIVYEQCVNWDSVCNSQNPYKPYRVMQMCCIHPLGCTDRCQDSSYWQQTYTCKSSCP
jgi:hypothetical protein